jgi:hypothetical protein
MRLRFIGLSLALAACSASQNRPDAGATPSSTAQPARFLYVWAGDKDGTATDFLAVYDVRPGSATHGRLLSTVPVNEHHTHPHHMQYELPPAGELLYISGYGAERIFLIDFSVADKPSVVRTLSPADGFRYPHDLSRLPNGHVLASYLGTDNAARDDGGLVEYGPRGDLLGTVHSADTAAHGQVRTYAMAILSAQDRLLTTSAPMHQDSTADVVQIWKLSTLELLKTIRLPDGPAPHLKQLPFEPRLMADGRTVLINTYGCGFYLVTGVETPSPQVRYVGAIADTFASCGVPVLIGNYWVMTVGKLSQLIVYDVADPAQPREVSRLTADSAFRPHWLARDPGSDRLIVGGENGGEERMLIARLDARTGRLTWDETLRSADGSLGINFTHDDWPHGRTGPAFAHAALFRP